MTVRTSLKDFLMSGRLGAIALGMTQQEVRGLLGAPEATSLPDLEPAVIWKYGSLEVTFLPEEGLHLIALELNDAPRLPSALTIEGYMPTPRTSLQEFKDYLHANGISCHHYPALTFDWSIGLIVGAGATVVFSVDPDRIEGIQYIGRQLPKEPLQPC